jgi:cation diffusion facilitator family transporter
VDPLERFQHATLEGIRDNRRAMRLSLFVGAAMFLAKGTAYLWTGSVAILSDAAESAVHLLAVGFASFSLWLSTRPANHRFPFGYERISFFSAGFEGALIILAAVLIFVTAIQKWIAGLELQHLGAGVAVVAVAGALNAALGWYLVRTGRRTGSIILEANGRHVLTDSWTSLGVVVGLILVMLTGWLALDPICAILAGANIIWSGGKLVSRSIGGLMDYSDPKTGRAVRAALDRLCSELGLRYHGARFRSTGLRIRIELHLLFPGGTPLAEAHHRATQLEERLPAELGRPAEVITHLEAIEDHAHVHRRQHYTGRPGG